MALDPDYVLKPPRQLYPVLISPLTADSLTQPQPAISSVCPIALSSFKCLKQASGHQNLPPNNLKYFSSIFCNCPQPSCSSINLDAIFHFPLFS